MAVAVAVVGIGISICAPLAVVAEAMDAGHGSVRVSRETVAVSTGVSQAMAVAVVGVSLSVSAPLAVVVAVAQVRTGPVDSALDTVANNRGPGNGDSSGSDQGVPIEGSLGL